MNKETRLTTVCVLGVLFSLGFMNSAFAESDKKAIAVIPSFADSEVQQIDEETGFFKKHKKKKKQNHYANGIALVKNGESDAALIEFLASGQENPEEVRAFFEQAKIFREKGHGRLAQGALEQALSVKPNYRDARVLLATIYLESGKFADAASELASTLGLTKQTRKAQKLKTKKIAKKNKELPNYELGITPSVIQMPHGTLASVSNANFNMNNLLSGNKTLEKIAAKMIEQATKQQSKKKPEEKIVESSNNTGMWDKLCKSYMPKLSFGLPNPLNFFKSSPNTIVNSNLSANTNEKIASDYALRPTKQTSPPTISRPIISKSISQAENDEISNLIKIQNKKEPEALVAIAHQLPSKRINIVFEKNPKSKTNSPGQISESSNGLMTPMAGINNVSLFSVPHIKFANNIRSTHDANAKSGKGENDTNDKWVEKMKYLVAHGTSTLSPGEAFMFSEETGEGVLFLANGQSIRRTIAMAKDRQEIIAMRRPDILAPKELRYSLSLLGTLLPRTHDESNINKSQSREAKAINSLSVDELLAKSSGFWTWLKDAFNF
jgi:tetratricopeptide (TPR) repeat protein